MEPDPGLLFEVFTPLGFGVRVTRERWTLITTAKHPVMAGREDVVKTTLEHPEQSPSESLRSSGSTLLPSRGHGSVGVCGREAGHGSRFLITAYPTDAIKEGTQIWPK